MKYSGFAGMIVILLLCLGCEKEPTEPPELEVYPTELDFDGEELRLHWTYFAQIDPEVVLGILRSLRLRAIKS